MTSVIFALAVAQILSGIGRLAQAQGDVRTFSAHTLWVVQLFVSIFLVWWATWEFREVDWRFPEYGYLLLAPTLLFFACSLIIPGSIEGRSVDLEAHFFRVKRPLMWTFLVFTLVIVFDGPVLGTEPIVHPVRFWHSAWLLAAVWGIRSENRVSHVVIAAVVVAVSVVLGGTRFLSVA